MRRLTNPHSAASRARTRTASRSSRWWRITRPSPGYQQGDPLVPCWNAKLEAAFCVKHERLVPADNTMLIAGLRLPIAPQSRRWSYAQRRVKLCEHAERAGPASKPHLKRAEKFSFPLGGGNQNNDRQVKTGGSLPASSGCPYALLTGPTQSLRR